MAVLSKSLGFEIVEWRNPATSDFLADDYISVSTQFEDFLLRGRQFNSLVMVGADEVVETPAAKPVNSAPESTTKRPQVVLIEDFPYAVLRMGTAVQSMRSNLLQCLASRPTPGQNAAPVVLIITESILSSNTSSADNFTAHRLLGPDILHHPACTTIEFNPVAPTFITKALNLAVQKHRRSTGLVLTPDPEVIRTISQIGDVRNAVATLEFLSARNDLEKSSNLSIPSKGKSRTSKSKTKSQHSADIPSTASSLSLVSLRESTIGLFHAVGKVVYNKRSAPSTSSANGSSIADPSDDVQLPPHLTHHTRSLPSEVSISMLIDETGTDISTFVSALHENYALSCASTSGNTEATLDTLNACLDALSDSDLLLGPSFSAYNNRSGISEGVRQDEMAFEASVRGLLHALPHPVKRQSHPGKTAGRAAGAADAHRMFYPTDLKTWRKKEEIVGLADMFAGRTMAGTLLAGLPLKRRDGTTDTLRSVSQPGRMPSALAQQRFRGGVESWRRSAAYEPQNPGSAQEDSSNTQIALGSGHSARQEMLLERLPYLARILPSETSASNGSSFGPSLVKQIQQVTSLTGIGVLQDEEEDGDPVATATTRGAGFSSDVPWVHKKSSTGDDELDVRGLVLSDDDIEDD